MKKELSNPNRFLTLLILITFISILTITPVLASGATISTDKADYVPEETVTIFGTGFLPNTIVQVEVTRPDSTVDRWNTTSDADGNFTTTYQLDGIMGTYNVIATDGTNTATTTFTDRDKLVFTAGTPQTLTAGTMSLQITVQRPSTTGFETVSLSSTSTGGKFYSDSGGNIQIFFSYHK